MSSGFKARRDDDVRAGLFDGDSLIDCGGGADSDDFSRAALVENFLRRNADNETENGRTRIEQGAGLRFERNGRVRLVRWSRRADLVEKQSERGESLLKFPLACLARSGVFHRNPEIDREGL